MRSALSLRDPGLSAGRVLAGLLRLLVLGLAAAAAWMFLSVALRRLAYPYDLEWMEGGMLCHALRLLSGQPIYAPPSVDFVPHLYTPLYPALVAGLSWIAGDVSYALARAVSLLSFAGAVAMGSVWAYREGGSLAAALAALALPVAAFPVTGGWYDLARSDSLQIFLTVLGAWLAWNGRTRHALAALAAAVLVLAFLAKQTAAPLIAFAGVGLLVALVRERCWAVLTLGLCGALFFGLAIYLIDRASGGWFWTYIFRIHQTHAFFPRRAFVDTPLVLLKTLGPAILVVPWALLSGRRQNTGGLSYLAWLGLGGWVASCVGFGTQWAHVNALIPGIFFPSIAIGAAAGRLASTQAAAHRLQTARGLLVRRALVFALLCGSLWPLLRSFRIAPHLPTAADRQAGDALIARLRAAPGEVLIPFHPFYGHLAGKRTFLHRMGVWDVRGTAAGPVRGLDEALRDRRFSLIVFDDKIQGTWDDWPGVRAAYHIVERFQGPREIEGAQTVPSFIMVPTPDPLPVDRELQ